MIFRPQPIMSLASAIVLAVLIGLGLWQVQRFEWKQDLVARLDAARRAPPVAPVDIAGRMAAGENVEFQRVEIAGFIEPEKVQRYFVGGDQSRPWVALAPVRTDLGVVWVDRGRKVSAEEGWGDGDGRALVFITGAVRLAWAGNGFTPPAAPEKGQWYAVDPKALTAAAGLGAAAPFWVAEDPLPDGLRNPRADPSLAMLPPSQHIGYALTWFGLALTLFGVYVGWHVRSGRLSLRRKADE